MVLRRATVMIAAMGGVLVVALMASQGSPSSLVTGVPSSSGPEATARSSQSAGSFKLSREKGPLLFGESLTLAEAEAKAGIHLPRPDSQLAKDSTVRDVFYEERSFDEGPKSYIVAIDYESGLIVYVHPASYDGDLFSDSGAAEKSYQRAADGLNAALGSSIASVKTILGVPALVIQRFGTGVSSVDLVLSSGLRVQLIAKYAPDMDASTVEAIAESLA